MASTKTLADLIEHVNKIEISIEHLVDFLKDLNGDAPFAPVADGGKCAPFVVCAPMAYYVGCEPPPSPISPGLTCLSPEPGMYVPKIRDLMTTMSLTQEMVVNIRRIIQTGDPRAELPSIIP